MVGCNLLSRTSGEVDGLAWIIALAARTSGGYQTVATLFDIRLRFEFSANCSYRDRRQLIRQALYFEQAIGAQPGPH